MAGDDLREQMADLARELESQDDPAQTLQHVVDAAVELVDGCEAASVSLASRKGEITTNTSTSAALARADELQVVLGEGPCIDAVWESKLITVADLRSEDRWPDWTPRIIDELGFLSMTCVRLFTDRDLVGALNLFSRESNAFSEEAVDIAVTVAAHAAVAVADAAKIAGLQVAIDNRTLIGQATGLAMAYYGLSAPQGFSVLRRLSNERNVKLVEVARGMVTQHERELEQPGRGRP